MEVNVQYMDPSGMSNCKKHTKKSSWRQVKILHLIDMVQLPMSHYILDQCQPLQTGSPNKSINRKSMKLILKFACCLEQKFQKHILPNGGLMINEPHGYNG